MVFSAAKRFPYGDCAGGAQGEKNLVEIVRMVLLVLFFADVSILSSYHVYQS